MDDCIVFVLAGGRSTRMGYDKAFAELDGRTLLSRALEVASSVSKEVRIVGEHRKFSPFGTTVEDVYRECGPLAGIHAALNHSQMELNLILAVDLPFVKPEFLKYLVSQARASTALVTVPKVGSRLQPLCAVYRHPFVRVADHALQAGKNRIDALFAQTETLILDEIQLSEHGFSSTMFRNLNTPDDLQQAEAL